jgi:hypothetical protein
MSWGIWLRYFGTFRKLKDFKNSNFKIQQILIDGILLA